MTDGSEGFGAGAVRQELQQRLTRARKSYEQIINRLWAGNGAGVLSALAAIGSGKASGTATFVALCAFSLGLALLAVMAVYSLAFLTRVIRDLEKAEFVLDRRCDYVRRPSEDIGLAIFDLRTIMGFLSATMFVVGAICGLLVAASVTIK